MSADSKSSTVLLKASKAKLFDYSYFPTTEKLGEALLSAAARGDHKKLKKILQKGIHVDYRSSSGHTALFAACVESHREAVELLLQAGANPNERGYDGRTSVHAAAFAANVHIISMLVDAGGDLRLHDKEGRSARDWAANITDSRKKRKMLKYLEKVKLTAINSSGKDVLLEQSLHSNSSWRNMSLTRMIRHRASKSAIRASSVQNHGFGKVLLTHGAFIGTAGSVPIVDENMLTYDSMGYSYDNGPFLHMESMRWNKVKVTVKRLRRDCHPGGHVDMLIAECEHMTRLRHPHILMLMAVCQTEQLESLVLIYERIACGSLYSFVHQQMEALEVPSVCLIIRQIADALIYIHQQNWIHCAVTSHAIQLVSVDSARLTNFEYMIENVSRDGVGCHSPVLENTYQNAVYNWLAPEILLDQPPTERSDLYSLTAVLWELLNETPPWTGLSAMEIKTEIVDLGHGLDGIESRPVSDPFIMLLQYGLSSRANDRHLNLEQMRDILTDHILDQEMLANTSNIVSLSTSSRSARRSHIKRSSVHQRQISVDDNQTFISDSIYMDKLSTTYEQHNSPIIRPDTEVDRTQMKLEYSETVVEKSPKSQSPRKQCLDETQLKEPVGHSDDGTRSSQSDGKFSIGNRVPDEITPRNSENVVRSPRSQRVERRPTEQTKPATKETSSSEISFRCDQKEGIVKRSKINEVPPVDLSDSTFVAPKEQTQHSTPKNQPAGNGRQLNIRKLDNDLHTSKVDESVQSAKDFSYEFIRNPAKKAFFEGTRSSSGSATVSPRSVNSPRLKQQVTFKEKADEIIPHMKSDRVCSPEREKRDSGPQQPSAAEHFAAQLPGINDENLSSFAIQLKKETEALLKPVTYKAEEKPRITAVGCKWMPPTSGSAQKNQQLSGGVSSAGVDKFVSMTERILNRQADEDTDRQKGSVSVSQAWKTVATYGQVNELDAKDSPACGPVQGLKQSPKGSPRNGTFVKELGLSYVNQKPAVVESSNTADLIPDKSNSSSTVLSGLSQTNGRTSVFETIAKHKSSATSSPRETRVFGTANAVTTYNMSEGAAKNLKLSGRQLWEFGTASESDNKVHVNSCSPMSRRSEPHKVSLTADKRTNFVKQNRYSASKVLRAQSNNHAMQSEFDDADGGDVNWKSSGCADDRCPMTGLVATRCSKTQSPKISLIAAVSNNVRQDVRNEQNWKVSPRRDDLHSKQSGHLPRLSVGRGRPSSSVFRQVTCGPVNDHNQSEKSVGHGSYVAAVSSARPVSIYPARSNPISSYKPASHHEPCFDV